MAQDDNYQEGVDFEYVQGNGDDNSNFKTRRFFTKAEKAKMNAPKAAAPKAAAPKAAAPKPKLKGITTVPITTAPLPEDTAAAAMKVLGTTKFGIQNYDKNLAEAQARRNKNAYPTSGMAKGGVVKMKEGTAKDMREDKAKAKKAGMSMKKWESSAADVKHDSAGMKRGGSMKKMAMGGAVKSTGVAKRGSGVEMKAMGGSVRGAGCAVRGKTGAKEY